MTRRPHPKTLLADAQSFPLFVHALIEHLHDGSEIGMSQHSRIPGSTIWRWRRALPGAYTPDLIRRLAHVYELPPESVWCLVAQDLRKDFLGQRIPKPRLGHVRPGPKPKRKR